MIEVPELYLHVYVDGVISPEEIRRFRDGRPSVGPLRDALKATIYMLPSLWVGGEIPSAFVLVGRNSGFVSVLRDNFANTVAIRTMTPTLAKLLTAEYAEMKSNRGVSDRELAETLTSWIGKSVFMLEWHT